MLLMLPSKYTIYLDANNVYGWAMSKYLPYNGFKWLKQNEIDKFDVNSTSENSSIGYILEVDLEYPDELHDLHNNYPLGHNMLSYYFSHIKNKYGIKVGGVSKLVPNLGNKS